MGIGPEALGQPRFQTRFLLSNFRIFQRPVNSTPQEGGKLTDIGFYEAAAGTDGKREKPNATLRYLSPATITC
jgi:hypothetical protein